MCLGMCVRCSEGRGTEEEEEGNAYNKQKNERRVRE